MIKTIWEDIDKEDKVRKEMTRFSDFTDDELDIMEEAFCNEGLKYLVGEIRKERRYRESSKEESER